MHVVNALHVLYYTRSFDFISLIFFIFLLKNQLVLVHFYFIILNVTKYLNTMLIFYIIFKSKYL